MALDPKIWGAHYWFVLHTIAISYPRSPNDVTKKKYYDFIQNLPLFLPVDEIGNTFTKYLDSFPVTPYLDSRESFIKWMHFIHNKINVATGQDEISIDKSMADYYEHYKPKAIKDKETQRHREKFVFMFIVIILFIIGAILYNK
jgi:hypothetical protein|tara:strand:- start:1954 stop:2385 length:432 start_codon:yes stop_codon:yes gene_type:complete